MFLLSGTTGYLENIRQRRFHDTIQDILSIFFNFNSLFANTDKWPSRVTQM